MLTQQQISELSREDINYILSQHYSSETKITITPKLTQREIIDEFLRRKVNAGLAESTIQAYRDSFKKLGKMVSLEGDISTLTQDVIERSIESLQGKLSIASQNKYLREIRTFYNDCKKRGIISHTLEIKELRVDMTPVYIPEPNLKKILVEMKPEHREYISLYLKTAARLREIYNATLEPDGYLCIPAELAKARKPIEIQLTPENIIIYKKLMASGLSPERLSRLFKQASVRAGYDSVKFHSLRHTGAIMELIRTNDIYHVSRMLHHSTVKTTESFYLRFSKRRIRNDFPSLYADK